MIVVTFTRRLAPCVVALMLASTLAWADHPVGVFGPSVGGPVVTPTASTLPAGNWGFSLYSEYRRFDTPSRSELAAQAAAESGHVHSLRYLWSPLLAISYGLTERVTVTAGVPYVKRSELMEGHVHGSGAAGVHDLGDSSGIGDVSLGGYWRFWENSRNSAAALSVGSFLPTGTTDRRNEEGERFATEHQPGTGAWRPFAGAIVSHNTGALGLHANLRYTWALEGAQDTDLGDKIDYGVALSYRLTAAAEESPHHEHAPQTSDHDHEHDEALHWDLLLELNGEYQRPQRIGGREEGESARIIYLAPGVRVTGRSGWTAALSVGAPIRQHAGAGHIETDWRVVATAGYSF